MDFDHVRGEKKFNISIAAVKLMSIAIVQSEIEKCDVVCANCHRERTFKRILGSAKGRQTVSETVNAGSSPAPRANDPRSSKGRNAAFEPANVGSIPTLGTK